jgi:hypothetical protein
MCKDFKKHVTRDDTYTNIHKGPIYTNKHMNNTYTRISQHFMEPEVSLPCSQEPSTGPYPEPDLSNPYHPIPSTLVKATIFVRWAEFQTRHHVCQNSLLFTAPTQNPGTIFFPKDPKVSFHVTTLMKREAHLLLILRLKMPPPLRELFVIS